MMLLTVRRKEKKKEIIDPDNPSEYVSSSLQCAACVFVDATPLNFREEYAFI